MAKSKQLRETNIKRSKVPESERSGFSRRDLKRVVGKLLETVDFAACLDGLQQLPQAKCINALVGYLSESRREVRSRAAAALGEFVAKLFDEGNEREARIMMRRLMWGLTEESGSIIWGAPEAMGEVVARCDGLAKEYAPLLVSLVNPAGNFLEHEPLLCSVVRAIECAAKARRKLMVELDAAHYLRPLLDSPHQELQAAAKKALTTLT